MNGSLVKANILNDTFENLANNNIVLNSEEKFLILISLQSKTDDLNLHKFFVSKRKGQSTSSIFLNVKTTIHIELCNSLLTCISEELFKKFTYYPRAEKNNYDFVNKVKDELYFNNQSLNYYTKITFVVTDTKRVQIWLIKNFPLKKKKIHNLLFKIIKVFSYNTTGKIPLKKVNKLKDSYDLLVNYINHKVNNKSLEKLVVTKTKKKCFRNSSILMKNKNTLFFFSSNKTNLKQNLGLINLFLEIRGISIKRKNFYNSNLIQPRINISIYSLVKSCSNIFTCLPSNDYLCIYRNKLKTIVKNNKFIDLSDLIMLLNKELKLWKYENFFLDNFQKLSKQLDFYLHRILWKYVKRLHSRRSNSWIYKKYWKYLSGNWRFVSINQATGKINILLSHSFAPLPICINRIPLITNIFTIFNFKKVFYIKFLRNRIFLIGIISLIYNRQKGLCYKCKLPIEKVKMKVHNLRKGILILIHPTCKF